MSHLDQDGRHPLTIPIIRGILETCSRPPILLEALHRDAEKRRSWGECFWTAKDVYRPDPVFLETR